MLSKPSFTKVQYGRPTPRTYLHVHLIKNTWSSCSKLG